MQVRERSKQPSPGAIPEQHALESHGLYRLGLNYGRQVYRFRWFILAFWIIIVAVSIPFTGKIGSVLHGGSYSSRESDSQKVSDILTNQLHQAGGVAGRFPVRTYSGK